MPKKSVREMSVLQRAGHSLGMKTFLAILLLVVIICMAAILMGFGLYKNAVVREYRAESWHLSRIATRMTDRAQIVQKTKEILELYDSIPEEDKREGFDSEYLQQFVKEKDWLFDKIQYTLHALEQENEAAAVYIAALDPETNRMIYLIDSDYNDDTFCMPGFIDQLSEEEISVYMEGAKISGIDYFLGERTSIPAYISDTERFGYICTSATYLFQSGKYEIFAFADMDMSHVREITRTFLTRYLLLMIVAALVAGLLAARLLYRKTVVPINRLAKAAEAYSAGKLENDEQTVYFKDIDVHTGDEIENLSLIMKDMERDMNLHIANLTSVTAEKERISTELDVASQIQEGVIPHLYPAFPDRPEFDIYALMNPAKEVGGDFYDFFLIDDDHLAMVMADVSDKGIPAALFMMASKIMIQNYSMINKVSPAKILSEVNSAICENNSAGMFVTVWLGILEISTGILTAANAGHEYPIIKKSDGRFELLKDKHGFVVGGMDGVVYQDYEVRLESGDSIFQYTDGVTEAVNASNEMFGMTRLIDALNVDANGEPEDILANVLSAIDSFSDGTPQFDDITMLCMKYFTGSVEVKELDIEAAIDNLPAVIGFLEEALENIGCPVKEQMQLSVAAEEIFVNIAHYAYTPKTGNAKIRIVTSKNPSAVSITFIDQGRAFNPLEKEDPDVTLPAEERQIGGLGIFMVKKSMDKVSYQYKDGKNILILKKKFDRR